MANTVLHKAETRGFANHGWLQAKHTFSFANYFNEARIHFGVLRVLNDDIIAGGMGFGNHPHDNMEIITIPLAGEIEHKDSMGNTTVVSKGQVQVMSAGTGIQHSEYNHQPHEALNLLQIWVFPNKRNVVPRYGQITLHPEDRKNKFQQIVSPNEADEGVWIHQNAWFYLGDFDKGVSATYQLKDQENGVYIFVIQGDIKVNHQELNLRDGFGIWGCETITIEVATNAEILLMEVPMGV
jgi:redox-sensitive bicupin YhaK (pirin superfamily)